MHRRTPSHFPRIGAFCPLAVRDAWLLGAQATPPIPRNHARIHYFCPDGNHLGLTVYAFGDTTEDTSNFNRGPVKVTGQDSFGAYFDLDSTSAAQNVAIIIHKGNVKDPGPNDFLDPATQASSTGSFRAEPTAYHSTVHDPVIRPTDSRRQGAHSLSSPR
jgi:pullulanase